MKTVGDVVSWWITRIENDGTRSQKYRGSMVCLMRKHVLPRVGKLPLKKVDRVALDDKLIFPMHQVLAPRSVQRSDTTRMGEGGRAWTWPMSDPDMPPVCTCAYPCK